MANITFHEQPAHTAGNLPEVGSTAANFTCVTNELKEVALADFKGKKVLLYFYPKALTPGCTTQACNLRDSKQELEQLGVVIMGISPDNPKKLATFEEKKSLNFILLADEDHKVAEQFGVWGEKKFMGRIFDGIHRISFLIDENGKIEKVFDKFKTSEHHQVVLDYLRK